MALEHSTLTGAQLHEPKGCAAAAANTVYVANGSGSGTWTPIIATPTYGEMHISGNATSVTANATPNTFDHLVNTNWVAGPNNNVTVNADDVNDNIVVADTGVYMISFWASIDATDASITAGDSITIAYAVNGSTNSRIIGLSVTKYNYVALSATGIVSLSASDALSLYFASDRASSVWTFKEAGLSLVRIA